MKTPFTSVLADIMKTEGSLEVIQETRHNKKLYAKLKSFEGLDQIDELRKLDVSSTSISSFAYCVEQPSLERFLCINTPLQKIENFEITALIALGDNLKYINKHVIQPYHRNIANVLRPQIKDYIYNNWLLMGLNPVRLLNATTRKRKVIYIELPSADTKIEAGEKRSNEEEEEEGAKEEEEKKEVVQNTFHEMAKLNTLTRKEVRGLFRKEFEKVIQNNELIRQEKDPKLEKRKKKVMEKREREENRIMKKQFEQNFTLTTELNEQDLGLEPYEEDDESVPPPPSKDFNDTVKDDLFDITDDSDSDEIIEQKPPPEDSYGEYEEDN